MSSRSFVASFMHTTSRRLHRLSRRSSLPKETPSHNHPVELWLLSYSRLTGTPEVSMMLSTPKLKVIHVTTHIGLIDAIAKIEAGFVERTIVRAQDTFSPAGIAHPRLAVCGINPHAGEHGLFGHGEEESKTEPAVRACQARGWNV